MVWCVVFLQYVAIVYRIILGVFRSENKHGELFFSRVCCRFVLIVNRDAAAIVR
jgi:hypothetical protein